MFAYICGAAHRGDLLQRVAEGLDVGVRRGERVQRDMIAVKLTPDLLPAVSAARGQFFGVLRQQSGEYVLTDIQLIIDSCLGVARDVAVHESECGQLHEDAQCHEKHDDSSGLALDAHQFP